MANNEEYDVKNFSDEELFLLMDLNNPTDRELEAKIYSFIDKYGANNSKPSMKMYKFFTDVFIRFFSSIDEIDNNVEGFETQYETDKTVVTEPPTPPVSIVTSTYSKGLLNPILKETIRRVVCVDSQYRDLSVYPNSGSFTFNLSDTLTDVVSLKLYSVHIPFTWFTISNDVGSNFFYIKGNVEGINIGNYEFKIEVVPGNYQSSDFTDSLNASLLKLVENNVDVDFGSTAVSYNTINSKLTLTIDIRILYNETNYELFFPPFPSYIASDSVISSLPHLLGYKRQEYYPFTAISSNTFVDTSGNLVFYEPLKTFRITNRNNKFTVYVYGSQVVDNKIESIQTHDLSNNIFNLSSSNVTYKTSFTIKMSLIGRQTAQAILDDVSSQIQLCPYLDPQQSSLVYDSTYNVFILKIRLNRKKVPNGQNYKSAVVFTDPPTYNPIWVGNNSLFRYAHNVYDLNKIESEVNNKITYDVSSNCIMSFNSKVDVFSYLNKSVLINSGNYNPVSLKDEINYELRTLNTSTFGTFDCSFAYNSSNIPLISSTINVIIPHYRTPHVQTLSVKNFIIKPVTNSIIVSNFGFNFTNINANLETSSQTHTSFFTLTNPTIYTDTLGDIITVRMVYPDSNQFLFFKDFTLLDYDPSGYTISQVETKFNTFFNTNIDASYNVSFQGSSINFTPMTNPLDPLGVSGVYYRCDLILNINVVLKNPDFNLELTENSTWNSIGFDISNNDLLYNPIQGTNTLYANEIYLDSTNNYFWLKTIADNNIGGVHTVDGSFNNIKVLLTLDINNSYSRNLIVENINTVLSNNPITEGSYFTLENGKSTFYMNIKRNYTTQDFKLVLFDSTFTHCNFGNTSIENVKWDTTLGWILGFRNLTEYNLTKSYETSNNSLFYYDVYPTQPFTVDSITNIVNLVGDTSVNVNLYNYFLLVIDDYCQNHLNDGLVTVTKTDFDIPLPSYANRTTYQCDASGQLSIVNGNLTSKQLYSANQLLNTKQVNQKNSIYSSGPFTQDIFALIPMKTSGLKFGQTYVDFSGTLQNQERTYFGPVNVRKMTIQLLNDKGGTLNLNGANWSFSLIVEQLYNPSRN